MPVDPNLVLATFVDDEGVVNYTIGNLASERLRQLARQVVEQLDPVGFARYREIKYGQTATPSVEVRRKAYAYLMQRAAKFAVAQYCRIEGTQ